MYTTCSQPVLSLEFSCTELVIQWTIFCHMWVSWCKNKCFWQRFTCVCVNLNSTANLLHTIYDFNIITNISDINSFSFTVRCNFLSFWWTWVCFGNFSFQWHTGWVIITKVNSINKWILSFSLMLKLLILWILHTYNLGKTWYFFNI